jgi:cation-transporting P-type ATPase C
LRFLKGEREDIEGLVQNIQGIRTASISCITENILVHYDQDRLTVEELRRSCESIISSFSLQAYKAEREQQAQVTVMERRLQEEPISEMVTRVAVTTVTLLFSLLRGTATAPAAGLLRRFLNVPALTVLSLSVPIFKSGAASLRRTRRPNADTLSATAILSSLIAGRATSALTIIWLADIAELLTAVSMDRTRKAIHQMLSVGEQLVWRLDEADRPTKVPIEHVRVDDRILVHTGEKISVDGVVESGEALVDQASITGEFLPAGKSAGDEVFAGTVIKSGRLVLKAEKVGDETAVSRIIHMVEEAQAKKAYIQAFADRFSARFIPVNFALALVVFLITRSFTRALNMLIIDYSCGVRLSTATALSATIGTAARQGILIKGSNYIEMLAEADTLILDKTGTITEGRPQVTTIVAADGGFDARRVVELAAAAEETSTHPMALAVMEKVRSSGWRIPDHRDTRVYAGKGIETRINGSRILVGSRRFIEENGINSFPVHGNVSHMAKMGESVIYVAEDRNLVGVIGIQDALKENMKKALNRLRYSGFDDIILLTGDVEQQAEIMAGRMAMDRYEAEVLPEDKAEVVLKLQSKGVHVVMVGDGINDAPALAYADVGIAMGGTRTDLAMEAADITITRDEPLLIPSVIKMAQSTMNIVKQNFAAAVGINSLGLVLASLGILPVFWSAVLHNATTILVVMNSGRLLFYDVEKGR